MRKRNNSQVITLLAEITPAEKLSTYTKMQLAARIEDLINEKGWNKSQFASMLNKQPSEVSKWLSGTHNFTIDTMADIANLFEISVTELMEAKLSQPVNESHFLIYITGAPQSIKYITPTPQQLKSQGGFQTLGTNYCVQD